MSEDNRSLKQKATVADGDDPVLQWVTFQLGEETYGINVMQVQEVLRHSEIAPVRQARPDLLYWGLLNLPVGKQWVTGH